MNRQASPEHQRGETVKTAGEDRCGEPTPGKNRLVIYQRTGNGIRDANQNRVPGTDAEHECENESGGGIPGGETQFGKQDDFRATNKTDRATWGSQDLFPVPAESSENPGVGE